MWYWPHKEPLSKNTHFYAKLSYSDFVIIYIIKIYHKFAELCFLTVSGGETPISGRRGVSKPPTQPPTPPPPFPRTFHSLLPRRFYCPLRFGRPSSQSIALLRKLPLVSYMMDPKSDFFSRPMLFQINLMFVIVFVLFCFCFCVCVILKFHPDE